MQSSCYIKEESKLAGWRWVAIIAIAAALMSGCSKSAAGGGKDSGHHAGNGGTAAGYMPEKQGTQLTYTIVSGDEMGAGALVSYVDIHDSAGFKVARVEASAAGLKLYEAARHNDDYTYTTSYLATAYYDALQLIAASFNSFSHEETPLTMKLPHEDALHKVVAPQTITATWHGIKNEQGTTTDSKMTQTVQTAVIDSSGTIKTAAGTYPDCIRVHYLKDQRRIITITSPDGNYKVDNTLHLDMIVWIAKGVGIVRSIERNLDNGVKTVTDLTKVSVPKG